MRKQKNSPFTDLGLMVQRGLVVAITAVACLGAHQAYATHAMGGDITYQCVGTDLYEVTLNFYRDCNGVSAPSDCSRLDFTVSSSQCGATLNECFTFDSFQNITPICFAAPDVCNDPNGQFGVEWYTYSATIDLSAYSGCGTDWLIEWDLPARNNAITSLIDPGNEELYISALLNNTLDACNSSPTFLNDPTPFTCINTPISYNHGVSDPDGDSLVFSFAPARGENGSLIPYAPGYSFDNPILTAGGPDAAMIDPVTGTITAIPNQVQFAVVTVLVQEYRDQQLIGEFTRDVQFSITNLPSCSNNYPVASGVNGTTDYEIEVCADSSFCFDINSFDADVIDSIYVTWNNGIPAGTFTVGPGLQPTATFCWTPTANDIGTHLFSVTVRDNACVFYGLSSYGYAITVTPPDAPADAGADQVICTNSTNLQGVLPYSESPRQWTLVSGSGTISNPNNPNTLVTGLGVGDNVFQWTIDYKTCGIESDQVTITVHDAAQAPANAGPDEDLCLPNTSTTLTANSYAYPATGSWSVVSGTGSFTDATDPTTGISGLSQGENTFEWTIDNGPCGPPTTDQVSIFVYDDTQAAANAGGDLEFCSPTSTANLAGNALTFPATGQWSMVSGSGSITTPSSPTSGVTGLAIGENIFEWSVDNGPCVPGGTSDQMSIFIFDQNAPVANAGIDQEICTPVSSTTLTGNTPTFPGSGTWSLVSGTGTIANPSDPGTLVTGLTVGENIFEWEVDNGPCGAPTTDQVSVFVFDAVAPVADAGGDQEFCTPTNTAAMTANTPLFPATGTWSLVAGTGTFTDPNSPTTTVTGLTVGVNTFRWTISNGPCPTASTEDEITVTIYDNNTPLADAGIDQEFCSPTSSTTVTGNILLGPAAGLWTLVSGTGNIVQPTNPVTQITGLSIGENIFQWAVDNGPCNPPTTDQISIFIFDENNPVADAGSDQSLCTPSSSTSFTGSVPVFPAVGTWTLVSGSGTITDPNDPATSVTGLPVGVHVFEWTMDNGPCATGITTDQIVISVFDENNPVADAGPDQQLCTPTTSTGLAGSVPITPAQGTWTVVSGSGNFSNVNDPNATVSGLSIGDNVFNWAMSNGPCSPANSNDQVTISVFDLNAQPANAGPDVDLCSPSSTYTMQANAAQFPGVGTWSVVQGTGNFSNVNNPAALVTGMSVGENIFEWSIDNGICGTSTDQMSVFIFDPNAPAANAGPDQEFCTPISSATMAANSAIFPGSGEWVLISGGGDITDPADPFTSITNLPIGENIFQWTIDNGPCAVSGTSDQMTISIFDENGVMANAGPDQELCTPTSSTTMAANLPTFPATGVWTLVSGTGTIAQPGNPLTAISDLQVGENIFEWTIDNGPCASGITTDQVSIFVFDANNAVAAAGPDQELCTPTTNTVLAGSAVTFPASGAWTLVSGTGVLGDASDPQSTVSGLGVGDNVFEWTVSNGPCAAPTSDQVTITVFDLNAPQADAGPDQEVCTPASSTTLAGNAPVGSGVGTWSLVQGSGSFVDANDPLTTVNGLTVGENILQWSIDNGICGSSTDQVSIFVFDENNVDANAGPDQELCSPVSTTDLAGSLLIFPATGSWTLVQGTGVFDDATDPSTQVTGLTIGENIFEWTVSNGPCANGTTTDQVSIFIFDENAPAAMAGPDQEFCTPTSSTSLSGNSPAFPATGTWTLVQGTGTIASPNDPNTQVTGLSIGENIFEWEMSNGPCANGISTDQVSIFIFDENNPVADAGPDQAICTPITSTTMDGNVPTFPAIGTWSLESGSATIVNANDPQTAITDLTVGTHVFVWSMDNGPCVGGQTTDTMQIEVFDEMAGGSNAGPDQELCSPTSSSTLAGNAPVSPAVGTWSLLSGTATIADVNDPNTAVTGMPVGTHIFQWEMSNGPCDAPAVDQVTIEVFDENNANADAGPDQEYCTPVSSTTLAGNVPISPAVGTWTLVSGGGDISDINDPAATVSNLPIGINIFEWTVYNGPCANGTTTDQVSISIFDENNPNADAGTDQEFCTPTSGATLTGSNVTVPAVGTWSLFSGSGVIVNENASVTIVTGLTIGENIFVWEVSNGPCANGITSDTVSVFIFDEAAADAEAGPDQELCTPMDSTFLQATVPADPATGMWALLSGTAVIDDPSDPSTLVSGMPVGTHVFEWIVDNGPCSNGITSDVVSIMVYDSLAPAADAGPDQELCLPTTTTSMAGNIPVFPGVGTWSLVSGSGTISNANNPNTAINGLAVGENVFVWEIYNGPCQSNGLTQDTVSIFLFDDTSPNANAGQDQEFCTPTSTATLNGNTPIFPSTGMWTLVSGSADIVDPSAPVTNVLNMPVGEHIFQWTVDNGPCANDSTSDQVSIFIFDENAPDADAGPDQHHCTPTNTTFLEGNVPVFPATGSWSLVNGTGTPVDPADPATEVTGLSIGENIFEWTVENGPCANGITSDLVSIFVYDSVQPPADAGMDQDLCTPNTFTDMNGSPVIFPAVGTWSLLSGTGTFDDANDPGTTVSGLSIGENVFVWTIDNGPCDPSLTTDTVSIFLFDGNALDAMAGPDQDFCSPFTSTTMFANAAVFPGEGTWFLVSGSADISDLNDPFAEISNLGWGENVFEWQIDNGPCGGTTSDQVSIFLYDSTIPEAYAGEYQQHCEPISDTYLEADPAQNTGEGSWQLIFGTGTIADVTDPESYLSDLVLGDNIFVWTVDNGTCGATSDTVTVNIKDCTTIEVPDAFSPNGDGTNDDFVIPNIEYYPENAFKVFNRWGDQVYEAAPYINDWDGRSESGLNTGEGLPESTYYYILDLGDGSEVLNGFIYLRR